MSKTLSVKISDALIKRYAVDPSVGTLRDTRHPELRFRFKVGARGSWFLVSYAKGKTRWTKLGNYPAVDSKLMIRRLPDLLGMFSLNANSENIVVSEWETVAGLLKWYLKRVMSDRNLSKKRKTTVKSVINLHLLPRLGDVLLDDLNHAVLDKKLIWPLQSDYALSTVRLILAVLKVASKQAATLSLIKSDPTVGLKFGDFVSAKIQPKGGALRSDAIPSLNERFKCHSTMDCCFVLLILLHGTRIGETRMAKWEHIDLVGKTWFIPALNTKTRVEHRLPLSDYAVGILRHFRLHSPGEFLFSNGTHSVCLNPVAANNLIKNFSQGKWSAHDLRKLARTCWMDLGIDYMVGEMLLNHALTKLDKTYIHTHAEEQLRNALDRYHAWLVTQGLVLENVDNTEMEKTPAWL